MKNKIFLLLILLITSNTCAYAIHDVGVISDGTNKKEVMDAFDDVNKPTDNFFTPHINKTVVKDLDEDEQKKKDDISGGTVPPVKKLRLMLKKYYANIGKDNLKSKQAVVVAPVEKDQAILDCDFMEYFGDRTELEANGHVVMVFPENNASIKADKMIYNQTSNLIKAFGHVVLINDGNELVGDYMSIDMNEENALMDNPVTDSFQIRAQAKKGYMYGDKIIQEQGKMYVTKKTLVNLKAEMFGPDLDAMYVEDKDKSYFMKDSHGEKFKIKTNDMTINSKKEHDTVTLRPATIYFNDKKVCSIPSITVHTNKAKDFIEADFPEIGTVSNLGMYAGPGFVFDTPKGSTLKLVPLLNYQTSGDTNTTDNKLGWGGIAKFKNASNKTDFAYGTANKVFIMRGLQKLDDNLYLQYAANSYMDDWFMGFRMPKLLGELVYQQNYPKLNFLGKDKDMTYSHRFAGAYAQDGTTDSNLFENNGSIGTMRLKYMGEVAQTFFKFNDELTSPINARVELVGEGSAAVYGTGQTQMIARVGPRIHSQYKYWMQDIGYFLSAYNDKTPFVFDRYMYGRSNVYARETFRLCKYLSLSWMTSLNLSQDSWDGKMLQENSFFFGLGPDDVKLNIGYDTIRQQSFVTMTMHLDAKGSTIEYKKMVIKNPDTFGKDKDGNNARSNSQSFIQTPVESDGIEKAEVVDIKEAL